MQPGIALVKHASVLANVDLLLALEATGSATQAAGVLKATTATVLRRLERLESELGVRFFDRHPNGLRPTPAFALVRPWAEQAQAAAVGLLRQLSQVEQRPAGVVRLACPPVVGSLFIVPALGSLRARFPELVVELVPATALVDLAQREADLALRTVKPTGGELVVQRLSTYRLGVFGAPHLRPLVRKPRRLADFPWVGWSSNMGAVPEAQWLSHVAPDAQVVFRSNELGALLAAARAGLGAIAVADVVASRAGDLEPLKVATPPLPEGAMWMVAHQALRPVPRVAAVWDWVRGLLTTEATGRGG